MQLKRQKRRCLDLGLVFLALPCFAVSFRFVSGGGHKGGGGMYVPTVGEVRVDVGLAGCGLGLGLVSGRGGGGEKRRCVCVEWFVRMQRYMQMYMQMPTPGAWRGRGGEKAEGKRGGKVRKLVFCHAVRRLCDACLEGFIAREDCWGKEGGMG